MAATGAVQRSVLAAVAVGGALGAMARYGASLALPHGPGAFPLGTFAVNLAGCALIGGLMVVITELWPHRRLLRPFLGTGVLGGFTTFSTYALDTQALLAGGHAVLAVAYVVATPVGALVAVWAAAVLTRRLVSRRLA